MHKSGIFIVKQFWRNITKIYKDMIYFQARTYNRTSQFCAWWRIKVKRLRILSSFEIRCSRWVSITRNVYLFCCSSTVTDGRVAGLRQGGCSPCRAHRSSNRSRAASRSSFEPFASPGTSPMPDSLVLRMPGILQQPEGILVIPISALHDLNTCTEFI